MIVRVAVKSGSTARTGGHRRRRVIGGRKSGACDDPLDAAASGRSVAHDYHRQTGYPTQVIADGAQDGMLPDGDVEADNPLKRMLHEDRDKALKVQVATQDPQDLEYTPLKQCRYWVWVGEWSTFHRGFINYFDLPKSELPTEPYQVVVFDKRMNVLHRTETKEEYARPSVRSVGSSGPQPTGKRSVRSAGARRVAEV
jgi:hypothetical protein